MLNLKKISYALLSSMAFLLLSPCLVLASTGITVNKVSPTLTPQQLVESLLGGGVSVSNVKFSGVDRSAGTFSGGTGILGFESGVVLSTGDISNIIGPNTTEGAGVSNNLNGDADLNKLIPGYTTNDATVLEFDFVPSTKEITFQYQFASDEYNEYVDSSFNDVFGFFVNGQNVALIPGTTTPVSVNNVNNSSNSSYYINNDTFSGAHLNTQMDGMTVTLTAKAMVNPYVTNHIKFAIADAGDSVLDSNVLIKAGSFVSDTEPPVLTVPKDVTIVEKGEKTYVDIGTATATDNLSEPGNIVITNDAPKDGLFPLGTTKVVWTAKDQGGNISTGTQNITVVPKTLTGITITKPPAKTEYTEGQSFNPSGMEVTAQYNNGTTEVVTGYTIDPSGALNIGTNKVTVSYKGKTAEQPINVIYNFKGFFKPIVMNGEVNAAKAGSSIPIKFSLGGNKGLNIFYAGYPKVYESSGGNGIETVTAGKSSLTYDASSGQYIYVWKTDKSWAGKTMKLVVKLNDGTEHVAYFSFK